MDTIGLMNEKGGTGKTTLAIHIAAGLAQRGRRVVVVDGDPQGNATLALGHKKSLGFTRLMIDDDDFGDVLEPVDRAVWSLDDQAPVGELWLLAGNIDSRTIPGRVDGDFRLRERLKELQGWADVVVFDTSPTPDRIHTLIYLAIDLLILPSHCSYLSLDGLASSLAHKERADQVRAAQGFAPIRTVGIIPTMYRRETEAHDVGIQQMTSTFRRLVWPCVPLRTVWEKASWVQQTIYRFAPNGHATEEMLGRDGLVDRVEAALGEVV